MNKDIQPQTRPFPYVPDNHCQIPVEPDSFKVLTPSEIDDLTAQILAEAENTQLPPSRFRELVQAIEDFRSQWQKSFSRFGHHRSGELAYQDPIIWFKEHIASKVNKWLPATGSGKNAINVIDSMLLTAPPAPKRFSRQLLKQLQAEKKLKTEPLREDFDCPKFEKPIFIVSAPRAGSTLLFETLSQFPNLWTIGQESHETIEGIPEFHPAARNFSSNRLTEADAHPHLAATLQKRFAQQLQDREGQAYLNLPAKQRPTSIRFLEKTPKNALRIPFLKAVFPEAVFIYLYRDPKENISSMMEGWRKRRFVAYRPLPGWPYREWCFLLIPGWSSLQDCSIVEITAQQWKTANAYILDDLQALPASNWCLVHYSDLVQKPKETIRQISQFAGLQEDQHIEQVMSRSLPISQLTLSAPSPDKWRKNEREIATVLPTIEPIETILGRL